MEWFPRQKKNMSSPSSHHVCVCVCACGKAEGRGTLGYCSSQHSPAAPQAWLTEIHEYAQKDVVIMLLGNKVCAGSPLTPQFAIPCRAVLCRPQE